MSGPGRGGGLRPARLAMALGIVALYLAAVAPVAARSYPSDDATLLVPTLLAEIGSRSTWGAVGYLFAPDQPLMPRALWKLYVLGGLWVLGPSSAGLVQVGLALHAASSLLVLALARRLALAPGAAWLASGLHLVAYPGSHAYLWTVGVQHVLTVLGVLATVHLYLVAEERRRAGAPWRWRYRATVALGLLSSLGRASSLMGPAAILVHALLAPAGATERLDRFDRWRPVVLLCLMYPAALVAWGGEPLHLGFPPGDWLRQFTWRFGRAPAWAVLMALVLALLAALRALLPRPASGGGVWPRHAGARAVVGAAGALLAAPVLLATALVTTWGVEAIAGPLGQALASLNWDRWHMTTPSASLLGAGAACALIGLFLNAHRRNPRVLVLLPLLALPAVAFWVMQVRLQRYWIYLTPALAIIFAAGLERGRSRLEVLLPGSRWPRAATVALGAAVLLGNLAAIRVATWRHTLADTYQVLEYIRVADLIRLDLRRSAAPGDALLCVDQLAPLPYEQAWRETFALRGSLREGVAVAVLAQTLGRRDLSGLRLDCGTEAPPGAYRYVVQGAEITRDGWNIDPFEHLHARARSLVASGDHARAAALRAAADARPFTVRYLLGTLPDGDMYWMTGGRSVLAWLRDMAENYDRWLGRTEPRILATRQFLSDEVAAYVRFRFLVEYARRRSVPPREGWEEPSRHSAFGALRGEELDRILRSDGFLISLPEVRALLDPVAAGSPSHGPPGIRNVPRPVPGLDLLGFLWRLLLSPVPASAA